MRKTYITFAMLVIWASGEIGYSQNRAPVRRGGAGSGGSTMRAPSAPRSNPGNVYRNPGAPNRPNYGPTPYSRPNTGGVYTRTGSGNIVYGGYRDRYGQVTNRLDYMRRDVRVGSWVNAQVGRYRSLHYPHYINRTSWYNSYYPTWRMRYNSWGRYGFYGGFYWNFRPVADIGVYFYNPMVSWFYSSSYDDYYYNTWYNSGITTYPQLRTPFPYTGAYYPTEEFRDLNLGMSQASLQTQVNYRTAMIDFTLQLQQQVSGILGYQAVLSTNDIVVTHYQQLSGDTGVVIEGWVSYQQQHSYPFKAYLNLYTGTANLFVTGNNGQFPSQTEIDTLNGLNSQIQDAGGVVEGDNYNYNFPQ
ncbi:MAG: hypothetical protein A4S09_04010 [Proteobacteria bacterium SG_bin7]|nr:MAG: hypothetical protein A4S09_04010 [Proteobacteria bacterium SG_bin7]